MDKEEVDAVIVPTDDPHMSEYVAPHFSRRAFISGFTGSAGTVVITTDKSLLFTDGRYHNQAEKELDSNWLLMKQGLKDVPTLSDYLLTSLTPNSVIGIDPLVHSADSIKSIEKRLFNEKKISVKYLSNNLIDHVWGASRPAKPSGLLRVHVLEHAGKNVTEKLIEVRAAMHASKASALVLTSLDEIAWLFNIRGSDVPCNPVTLSYAVLQQGDVFFILYILLIFICLSIYCILYI
jgi:Xaa-Pro aminopeptidase